MALNATNHNNKRDRSALSPEAASNKRYLFEPNNLLKNNRFYIPSSEPSVSYEENNVSTQDNSMETPQVPITPKPKIPPIYLHEAKNYQQVIKDVQENIKEEFSTAYKGNFLRINLTNINDFRNLTKYYDLLNIQYHTFKDPETQPLSVILRSVPISITEDELKNELLSLKLPVLKVARLYNKSQYPIPVCAVDLTKTEEANQIFAITKILHCIINVEPRRKSPDIPQCSRCQSYDCTKTPQQKPQCVNCDGEHPANYRGCPYFQKISQKVNKNHITSENRNKHHTYTPEAFPSLPNSTDAVPPAAAQLLNLASELLTPLPLHQIKITKKQQIL
ncbi:hypothetical protein RI129_001668 [Pyrocoelia pectoralis]|uniref:Pre-C2HC domain-containing protein n=1 Tax=Pyrocoelia pectoralis TaxID=417401 RepID=A0AAN7VW20_9COLE